MFRSWFCITHTSQCSASFHLFFFLLSFLVSSCWSLMRTTQFYYYEIIIHFDYLLRSIKTTTKSFQYMRTVTRRYKRHTKDQTKKKTETKKKYEWRKKNNNNNWIKTVFCFPFILFSSFCVRTVVKVERSYDTGAMCDNGPINNKKKSNIGKHAN